MSEVPKALIDELIGDEDLDDEGEALTESPTPEAKSDDAKLLKQIEELKAKLAAVESTSANGAPAYVPTDPNEWVEIVVPKMPNGPVRINGVVLEGVCRVQYHQVPDIMHIISSKQAIESERMAERGNMVPLSRLKLDDITSRISKPQSV